MTMKFYATKIVEMGDIDRSNIQYWIWNNTAVSGKNIIAGFNNSKAKVTNWANFRVYVPKLNGKAIINDNTSGSSPLFSASDVKNSVQYVDMQHTPTNLNRGGYLFINCFNLRGVVNLNKDIKHMPYTFQNCRNLNFNVILPSTLLSMEYAFQYCTNLNQNIQIPSKVTTMKGAFQYCYNLNQNIKLPDTVQNLSDAFRYCNKLKQSIQIPKSVTNMYNTFAECTALTGRINVLATELINTNSTFYNTTGSKQVYIYFKYKNGVSTKTYNLVCGGSSSSYNRWDNVNGVKVYNLGACPW